MTLLIKIAWRNIWRQRRRSLITVGAMAFGVALSMACVAWSDGIFQDGFDLMVSQTLGHVQVHNPNYPKQHALYDTLPQSLNQKLKSLPALAVSSARLFGFSLVAAGDEASGAQLIGVIPEDEAATSGIDKKVQPGGHWLSTKPDKQIVLGAGLAETLKVKVGAQIVVVTQAADGSMGNDLLNLVGIVKTGSVTRDRGGAFMHLSDLQDLLVLPNALHEISMLAQDNDKIPQLKAQVVASLSKSQTSSPALVQSWDQINPMAKQMLGFQDAFLFIMLVLVYAVASLGILNTMLMSVFERTKEFGVMRAIGVRPGQIVGMVLIESGSLAVIAAILGGLGGLALDAYLVIHGIDLSDMMNNFSFGGLSFNPLMRGYVRPQAVIITLIGLVIIALLSALWPAIRAARLKPVDAMRED